MLKRNFLCGSWCIWLASLNGCSDTAKSPDDAPSAGSGSISISGNGNGNGGGTSGIAGNGSSSGQAGGGSSNAGRANGGTDAGETRISCPDGVVEGKVVVVRNAADYEALLPCKKVTGDLLFGLGGEIDLPNLEYVGGELDPGKTVTAISAPALKTIEGDLPLWLCDNLVDVNLPELESVGIVKIEESPALVSVHLPKLNSAYAIHVESVDSLTTLELPALTTVFYPNEDLTGNVTFYGAPKLRKVELPSLTSVEGAVGANTNDALEVFELPLLETTNQFVFISNPMTKVLLLPKLAECTGDFTVNVNDSLESISMPALEHVVGFMFMAANPMLAELELPSFVHADYDSLTIRGNKSLPQCAVEEIVSRLDPPVESLTLEGNLGTCP